MLLYINATGLLFTFFESINSPVSLLLVFPALGSAVVVSTSTAVVGDTVLSFFFSLPKIKMHTTTAITVIVTAIPAPIIIFLFFPINLPS